MEKKEIYIIHNRGMSVELLKQSKVFLSKEELSKYVSKHYNKKDIKNFNDGEITGDGEKITIIEMEI